MSHEYVPDGSWTQHHELGLIKRWGSWFDVPSQLRYEPCTEGDTWLDHTATGKSTSPETGSHRKVIAQRRRKAKRRKR